MPRQLDLITKVPSAISGISVSPFKQLSVSRNQTN